MRRLAAASKGPGNVYFTGGATMLLLGIRDQTIDVDIKLDPEPKGAFEAIARLKDDLDLNIELASPADFLPPPPDWREKSAFIIKIGDVGFYHFDFRGQALAKLERGHEQDIHDVTELIRRGMVRKEDLPKAIDVPNLIRYPAVDADVLIQTVQEFVKSMESIPK